MQLATIRRRNVKASAIGPAYEAVERLPGTDRRRAIWNLMNERRITWAEAVKEHDA
jgi:hypothetical protein